MENINLHTFMLDFVVGLLSDYADGKQMDTDRDARLMAQDTLNFIREQVPQTICGTSLLTGETVSIKVEG